MANELRSTFIRSKMNKDLDARIVPPGEYRDAVNIAVSKSEGADVGALENVLGNELISDFGLNTLHPDAECIGMYGDKTNNRIVVTEIYKYFLEKFKTKCCSYNQYL